MRDPRQQAAGRHSSHAGAPEFGHARPARQDQHVHRYADGAADTGLVLTARCENHLHGVDDLDDTIARLLAYRDAGADVVYAPGLAELDSIARVVDEVGLPVNVLALPNGPTVDELGAIGVRRVSTGGALAKVAYGALLTGGTELRDSGTSRYSESGAPAEALKAAFGRGYTSAP